MRPASDNDASTYVLQDDRDTVFGVHVAQGDLELLRGKRLFITGGTGFVGCWLLEALLWANRQRGLGSELVVLSRSPETFAAKAPVLARDAAVTVVRGDMSSLAHISGQYDFVIHAATDVVNASADPQIAYDAIVNGTREVLALAKRVRAGRFLYVSSGAVYGRQTEHMERIPENHTGAPLVADRASAYGQAKRASEWLLNCYAQQHGFAPVTARLFALLGPYLQPGPHFAAASFIGNALKGEPMCMTGDGSTIRSYLYGADMAVWLLKLLVHGRAYEAYNVGAEQPVTIGELAKVFSDVAYGAERINFGPGRHGSPDRYVPDTTKARNELGLGSYTDLRRAVAQSLKWAQCQRATFAYT